VLSLEAFVQASYDTGQAVSGALAGQGAVALQVQWQGANPPATGGPQLEWVPAAGVTPRFAWANTTTSGSNNHTVLTVFASVVTTTVQDAAAVVAAAVQQGWESERARSAAWWTAFWPQAFVTLPTTRLEGYYYVELYRFAASDRTTLHGLMGAFGPTGMFNYWGVCLQNARSGMLLAQPTVLACLRACVSACEWDGVWWQHGDACGAVGGW
jgi:hypothetical protein